MAPDVDECTIQSVLGWWQGREDYLLKTVVGTTNGYNYTYLDHAIYCSKYEMILIERSILDSIFHLSIYFTGIR